MADEINAEIYLAKLLVVNLFFLPPPPLVLTVAEAS